MSRKLSLRSSRSGPAARWFPILAGAAIGSFLGWLLFMAPRGRDADLDATSISQNRRNLTVEITGTPVTRLTASVSVGEVPPDFELTDLSGNPHSLSQHRGEAVILNFWTTWCPPCRFEMPALQQVYEKYKDQGFTILGINLTESDDEAMIEPYREELGLTFPILLDRKSEVSESLYRVLGLPTSVFIDRQGVVREVYIGAIPLDDLEDKVLSIMEVGL